MWVMNLQMTSSWGPSRSEHRQAIPAALCPKSMRIINGCLTPLRFGVISYIDIELEQVNTVTSVLHKSLAQSHSADYQVVGPHVS